MLENGGILAPALIFLARPFPALSFFGSSVGGDELALAVPNLRGR